MHDDEYVLSPKVVGSDSFALGSLCVYIMALTCSTTRGNYSVTLVKPLCGVGASH